MTIFVNLTHFYQGLEKVLSGHPGQIDFPAGQVKFHSHLPNGQRPGKLSAN